MWRNLLILLVLYIYPANGKCVCVCVCGWVGGWVGGWVQLGANEPNVIVVLVLSAMFMYSLEMLCSWFMYMCYPMAHHYLSK